MKINISIIIWINRILMIPFLISLLILIIASDYIFYSMYIAFAVGCFQVFSCLNTLFYFKRIEEVIEKLVIIYIFSVVFYFFILFLLDHFSLNNYSIVVIYSLAAIPIILSLFWTYILESIKLKK